MSNIIEPMKFKFKRKTSTTTSNADTNSHQQTINSFFKVKYKLKCRLLTNVNCNCDYQAARDDKPSKSSGGIKRTPTSPIGDDSESSIKKLKFTNDSLEESDNWPDLSDDILDEKNSLVNDIFGTESPLLTKKKPGSSSGGGCIWTDSSDDSLQSVEDLEGEEDVEVAPAANFSLEFDEDFEVEDLTVVMVSTLILLMLSSSR